MKRLRSKLTYSNVMVTILALLVLGGGTAYAASQFERESVGSAALKKEAVTPAKLSKKAKATLSGPSGPAGPKGAPGAGGPQGPKGDTGASATRLWASISKTQALSRGSGVTAVASAGAGTVKVAFNQDVSQCGYAGTIGEPTENEAPAAFLSVQPQAGATNTLFVRTYNQAGTITTEPFYVAVFC